MSWKVYCDDHLLYRNDLEDYKLIDPSLVLELNKAGSFTFTIYPTHPRYGRLEKLKSIITVQKDDKLYFRGRILNDTVGWFNEKKVVCEGELAFLVDSIQRPFKFPADENSTATPAAYFSYLITNHNEQVDEAHQFTVGTVTVTDSNDYIARSDIEYSTTLQLLKEGLISTHGGYLWPDYDTDGKRRLNYLSDFNIAGNQSVEFGQNLLDISTERKGEDIATAILPLGKRDEETGDIVTISDLDDEDDTDICKSGDIVYSKAAETKYGHRITKKVNWDNVTQPVNLLSKAKEYLGKAVTQSQTTEITAVDLSAAGYNFDSFELGTKITVNSPRHEENHAIAAAYLVKKLSIKLEKPEDNKLTVGSTITSFTEKNRQDVNDRIRDVKTNVTAARNEALQELERRVNSAISQSADNIKSEVSETYYSKSSGEAMESRTSSVEQRADSIDISFKSMKNSMDGLRDYTDAELGVIKKYIRFIDGNIVLGEEGNAVTLKIQNNRISFLQNNAEVAYFSNNNLYVGNAVIKYGGKLQLGNFSFVPRSDGSLSFLKV